MEPSNGYSLHSTTGSCLSPRLSLAYPIKLLASKEDKLGSLNEATGTVQWNCSVVWADIACKQAAWRPQMVHRLFHCRILDNTHIYDHQNEWRNTQRLPRHNRGRLIQRSRVQDPPSLTDIFKSPPAQSNMRPHFLAITPAKFYVTTSVTFKQCNNKKSK